MAMKKEPRREHNPVPATSPEASELAAQLAPPEERDDHTASRGKNNGGAFIFDTDSLNFPKGFVEEERDDSRSFWPDPVVILIFFLSLAFIAFITYLISIEPPR